MEVTEMAAKTTTPVSREQLRKDRPDTWIAVNEGDTLVGKVLDVQAAWSEMRDSFYPVIEVEVEGATGYPADTKVLRLHCFRTVLYREIERHKPEPGERIAVEYQGAQDPRKVKAGQSPAEIYRVRMPDRQDGGKAAYEAIYGANGASNRSDTPQAATPDDIPF